MNSATKSFMAAAVIVCALSCAACDDNFSVKEPTFKSGLPEFDNKASDFAKAFPRQYASYRKNDESTQMTEYKGSINFQKHNSTKTRANKSHISISITPRKTHFSTSVRLER